MARGTEMDNPQEQPSFARFVGKKVGYVVALIALLLALLVPDVVRRIRKESASPDVRNLLDAQQTAWNAGDLDGFMLGYWNDPELTFYTDNTVEKGYEPLKQRYFKKYKADGKEMGKLTFSDVEAKPQSPTFVVVRGKWKLEKSTETRDGLYTLWVEEKPEGWRIVHDHSSVNEVKK
jgi:ketosteroid isomerase-like protein